jgi:hypothetical protein
MTDADHLLEPDALDDLTAVPIEELRRLRAEHAAVETGLSYLRRMVQGPLDIVRREQARRAGGERETGLSELVEELPGILADGPRGAGLGRLPQTLEPTEIDPALQAELDALVGDGRVAAVTTMDDEELAALARALAEFEARVSARRRAFHERLDALQAELARRYRTGEASVESLLD